jgi:uncharacterized protein
VIETKKWHTREESGIRLDRRLRWFHDDERVEHPRIIEAFNQGLRVAEDGRFKLEIGTDWCFVTVEDAAFEVLAVDVSEGSRPSIRLSDRTAEWLDPASLAVDAEGVLTVQVKNGRAKARFSRDAQFALGTLLEADGDGFVLRAGEKSWPTSLRALPEAGG